MYQHNQEEEKISPCPTAWKELQLTHYIIVQRLETEAWFTLHLLGHSSLVLPPSLTVHLSRETTATAHSGPASPQPVSEHPSPSLISFPAHSFSWKVTVLGYTYCGVSITGILLLCRENRPSVRLAAAHSSLHEDVSSRNPASLWVASWEDSMALRLIFTKNKHKVG